MWFKQKVSDPHHYHIAWLIDRHKDRHNPGGLRRRHGNWPKNQLLDLKPPDERVNQKDLL